MLQGCARNCPVLSSASLLWSVLVVQAVIPNPPTNFRVTFVTSFEVALQWDPVPNALQYKLKLRDAQCTTCLFRSYGPDAGILVPYMRLGDLQDNTLYEIFVYAENADGLSPPAALINPSMARPVHAPQPPTNLREVSHDENSVTLQWDPPANPSATQYQVFMSECTKQVGQGNCSTLGPCLSDRTVVCSDYALYHYAGINSELNSSRAFIANLHEYHIYFFYVQARNFNIMGYENGGGSPIQVVPRPAYSKAAIDLEVLGVTTTSVLLAWTAAIGAVQYKVQWRIPASANAWTGSMVTPDTQVTVTGLSLGVHYDFRVLATDLFLKVGSSTVLWAGDESGSDMKDQYGSNLVFAVPIQPLTVAPSALRVTGYRDTEVQLQWTQVPGAYYYHVLYRYAVCHHVFYIYSCMSCLIYIHLRVYPTSSAPLPRHLASISYVGISKLYVCMYVYMCI